MLFTLDPTTKTSIQQEERCLGPTHFHYKRHRGRVHPVSLHPSKMQTSLREVCPASTDCSGAPQVSDPGMPGCTVTHAVPAASGVSCSDCGVQHCPEEAVLHPCSQRRGQCAPGAFLQLSESLGCVTHLP